MSNPEQQQFSVRQSMKDMAEIGQTAMQLTQHSNNYRPSNGTTKRSPCWLSRSQLSGLVRHEATIPCGRSVLRLISRAVPCARKAAQPAQLGEGDKTMKDTVRKLERKLHRVCVGSGLRQRHCAPSCALRRRAPPRQTT